MPKAKLSGDPIGATITFKHRGPGGSSIVGVVVETDPTIVLSTGLHLTESADWATYSAVVGPGTFTTEQAVDTIVGATKFIELPGIDKYERVDTGVYKFVDEAPSWLSEYWYILVIAAILIIILMFVVGRR